MISREKFKEIKDELSNYKYNSLYYVEYDEVSDFHILSENGVIVLHGYNKEAKLFEFYWAANEVEQLLDVIRRSGKNGLITFVPEKWQDQLKKFGFSMYAVWNEYYNYDYFKKNQEGKVEDIKILKEEECKEASEVTLSCRFESRGFTGQTEEWIREWIHCEEPSAVNSKCKNNAVLVHKEEGQIVGIVCVGIYGHDSKKGPILWVREIVVKPGLQHKGIGKKLIGQALYYGKIYGATRSFLAADECNRHAINLYTKMGYVNNPNGREINMILE